MDNSGREIEARGTKGSHCPLGTGLTGLYQAPQDNGAKQLTKLAGFLR